MAARAIVDIDVAVAAEAVEVERTRTCRLDRCHNFILIALHPRRLYCCNTHGVLDRVRRHRSKRQKAIDATTPYLVTAIQCPIDGRFFPIEMYERKRGRRQKYDCDSCCEIARQLREHDRETKSQAKEKTG